VTPFFILLLFVITRVHCISSVFGTCCSFTFEVHCITQNTSVDDFRAWYYFRCSKPTLDHNDYYLRLFRRDIVFAIVTSFKGVFRRCLFGCLSATLRKNFRPDLHEFFRDGWKWADEQNKFWWRPDQDPDTNPGTDHDPDRDTGKTCLDGGMHYHSASSLSAYLSKVV